ncbi:MAG: chitobiase/beta-hexosaminidase C-terminal domain-containing protein [Bacteroidales bacterium]|nr:chitobiase/beta-hexosaminidase C-terminal domain-containing protein [Bacteroidales bacterium]
MRAIVCAILFITGFSFVTLSQTRTVPEENLMTPWAETVNPGNAWQEYPRPQFVREEWQNLNGLWEYAITEKNEKIPDAFEGEILVPFPVESALSGVNKKTGPEHCLWYRKKFLIPDAWAGKRILLHFEACDWETEVWVNGKKTGSHRGGYTPFSFDITAAIALENELIVRVWDPTDTGYQPVGKQANDPGGIFYTSTTGIWQTVWLEPVGKTCIESVKAGFDREKNILELNCTGIGIEKGDSIEAIIYKDGQEITRTSGASGSPLFLNIMDPCLWSPDQPCLYDGIVHLKRDGETPDRVKTYFGLREISLGRDAEGHVRIMLNGEFVFQNGPLDQGFWPDGIYTPPSEEAMVNDLKMIKALGFNMLRKHVKVENRRFYHWCDRMGILVWQDMPNGDLKIGPSDPDIQRNPESAARFEYELSEMINTLYNHPSIIMWVPFNEGWGQYETGRITDMVKDLDLSRLVNSASGWADRGNGDIYDIHHYPDPAFPQPDGKRAIVLGEFGGLGLPFQGHLWEESNWGYSNLTSADDFMDIYEQYYDTVFRMKDAGLSACIYTQLTDVETETNGLMTYDRKVVKADTAWFRSVNTGDFIPAPRMLPLGNYCHPGDSVYITATGNAIVHYTLDGSLPGLHSPVYSGPVVFREDMTVRAVAADSAGESRVQSRSYVKTNISRPVYAFPYSPKYMAGGDYALLDGLRGSTAFRDGKWQGIKKENFDITFAFDEPETLCELEVGFLEATGNGIFPPLSVTVYVSGNGVTFREAATATVDPPAEYRDNVIHKVILPIEPQQVKYIRVEATNPGLCPDWHKGRVMESWIFMDEIAFK